MPTNSLLLAALIPLITLLYFQYSDLVIPTWLESNSVSLIPRSKTPVIVASTPVFSHMEKVTTIAEGLMELGYPVIFITGPDFKDHVEAIGASYVAIEDRGSGLLPDDKMSTFLSLKGDELEIFAFKTVFLDEMPAQYRTLQRVFEDFRRQYGSKQPLVYVADYLFLGLTPVILGAPGTQPDVAVSIGLTPYVAASNDTFPFRSARHPDTTTDSKRIHFEAQQAQYNTYPDSEWNKYTGEVLHKIGATRTFPSMFDMFAFASDVFLQYGVPGFEYPRSDVRPNLKFIGAPPSIGIAERTLPPWWDDVVKAKESGKHIVAVTSSSVVFDNNALIIPALEALKDQDDVFVIATLVTSDIEQLQYQIPKNARVAKFIPLDLVLPKVSVLITNGGYGTIQQSLRAGVPIIVSGVGQDKSHTGALINYIGNGIYYPVHQMTAKMIGDAFGEIVRNETYRAKSEAISREYQDYNSISIADSVIQQAVGKRAH